MRILVACCSVVLVVVAYQAGSRYQDSRASASPIHDLSMKRIEGTPQKLSDYKGKVVLIVNVASECGMTPQYEGLQKLHAKYAGRGFAVLGFPSNDYGNQEPGSDEQILAFGRETYGVTFPLFSKTPVKGAGACPLYRYLQFESPSKAVVGWNFHKYLIDGSGNVIASFAPKTTPDDPKLVFAIETALGMKPKPVESKPAGPRLELIQVAYDGLKLPDGSTFSEAAERQKRAAAREDGRRYEPAPGIEWRSHKIDPDSDPPQEERGEFLFRGGGVFTEADLTDAKPDRDKIGQRTVIISVKPERQAAFETFTAAWVNRPLALVFDGVIVTAPVVQQPLKESIQIRSPGGFTKRDQQALLDALKTVK